MNFLLSLSLGSICFVLASKDHHAKGKEDGEGKNPPVPWMTLDMLPLVDYRASDIIVSVPGKSGTTWTMNMVHQLRSGGDGNFTDLYWEVPWIEFLEYPGQPLHDLLSRWEHFPRPLRRAFKSHNAPPLLPYLPQVKYVVVVRNGLDAVASMVPFFDAHSAALLKLWKMKALSFSAEIATQMMSADTPFSSINFVREWWPYRHNPNVFMVHFNELKSSLPAVLRRLAMFLDIEVSESHWPAIEEYCSFDWMRNHSQKFEATEVLKDVPTINCHCTPILNPGGMVRKGLIGHRPELTPELEAIFEKAAHERLTEEQYNWYFNGGVLPPFSSVEQAKQEL